MRKPFDDEMRKRFQPYWDSLKGKSKKNKGEKYSEKRRKIYENYWNSLKGKKISRDVIERTKLKHRRDLAKKYGVCKDTIRLIKNGKIWKHIRGVSDG
jgi:hypothetical protein